MYHVVNLGFHPPVLLENIKWAGVTWRAVIFFPVGPCEGSRICKQMFKGSKKKA